MLHEQALRQYYESLINRGRTLDSRAPVQEVRKVDPAAYTKPIEPLSAEQLARYRESKRKGKKNYLAYYMRKEEE